MKNYLIAGCVSLLATAASAGSMWESYGIQANPMNAAKIAAATDQFMKSAEGKTFPGKMMLLANMGNGADPTTHSWVLLYKSAADSEKWGKAIEGSKAWNDFMAAIVPISTPTADVRYALLKSWGTPNDETTVWEGHMIKSSDPQKTFAAMDKWMKSAKGRQFPGEVHLSVPIAAGVTPMTHFVSVGFKSEADAEAWNDSLETNADWGAFMTEIDASTEYLGATMSREISEWGKPMAEMTN